MDHSAFETSIDSSSSWSVDMDDEGISTICDTPSIDVFVKRKVDMDLKEKGKGKMMMECFFKLDKLNTYKCVCGCIVGQISRQGYSNLKKHLDKYHGNWEKELIEWNENRERGQKKLFFSPPSNDKSTSLYEWINIVVKKGLILFNDLLFFYICAI